MAGITKLLASLTPAPFINPEEYDGLEVLSISFKLSQSYPLQFRWKYFVFRPARKLDILCAERECNTVM
jgi:hypothetical protein